MPKLRLQAWHNCQEGMTGISKTNVMDTRERRG